MSLKIFAAAGWLICPCYTMLDAMLMLVPPQPLETFVENTTGKKYTYKIEAKVCGRRNKCSFYQYLLREIFKSKIIYVFYLILIYKANTFSPLFFSFWLNNDGGNFMCCREKITTR